MDEYTAMLSFRQMFKDEEAMYLAVLYDSVLDERIRQRKRFDIKGDRVLQSVVREVDRRAAQVVSGLLQTLKPEISTKVRRIDARVIWEIYWRLQVSPIAPEISIFELLGDLNMDPPFQSFFC